MDPRKDYYATLGVLPSAEDIVIRAAYKALAQRYHPDRAPNDPSAANRKMADINEAYSVLSDSTSRSSYDSQRGTGAQSADAYFAEAQDEDAKGADPLDTDWALAKSYFPDLAALESKLARVSWRLAYAFRAHLLETKQFQSRQQIAQTAETQFLKTYFGTNPKIVEFARSLISASYKAPAKALNDAVRVLGSGVEAEPLIRKITADFSLHALAEADRRDADTRRRAEAILENPRTPIDQKIELLQRLGGRFDWDKGFFRSSCRANLNGIDYVFTDGEAFSQWINRDIVPQVTGR